MVQEVGFSSRRQTWKSSFEAWIEVIFGFRVRFGFRFFMCRGGAAEHRFSAPSDTL